MANVKKFFRILVVLVVSILASRLSSTQVVAQDTPPLGGFASDAVLIQFAPNAGLEPASLAESATGGDIVKSFSLVPGLAYMRLPADADIAQAIATLQELNGSATSAQGKPWSAAVTIVVHDEGHRPVPNAILSGAWSTDTRPATCQTTALGQCTIAKRTRKGDLRSVTFRVIEVAEATHPYQPSFNRDPDGDSTGTMIMVMRP